MPTRLRKLIGGFALVFGIILYIILVTILAGRILPGAPFLVEMLFYGVAGIAWAFPVRGLILWMNRPDP